MALWLVRCGRHGEGENVALGSGVVGVGWAELGDLSTASSLQEMRDRIVPHHPDAKPSTVTNWAGQLHAFRSGIEVGDLVALPLKTSPAVAFGRVTGDYTYASEAPPSMRHQRSVTWLREDVPRDAIDQDLLYSLGAFLTVCRIKRNNAEERILALLAGAPVPAPTPLPGGPSDIDETEPVATVDLGELSRDQIRQHLAASGGTLSRPRLRPVDRAALGGGRVRNRRVPSRARRRGGHPGR